MGHKDKNLENSKCDVSKKLLTLDEAIAHAERCADNTPCGRNHKQLADWLKELRCLKSFGNIAAMCKALDTVCKVAAEMGEYDSDDAYEKMLIREWASRLVYIVNPALAAPLRNCDVGTVKEQTERFETFCQSNMQFYRDMYGRDDEGRLDGWDCREDCPIGKMIDSGTAVSDHCQLAWAQMPYEKNKETKTK